MRLNVGFFHVYKVLLVYGTRVTLIYRRFALFICANLFAFFQFILHFDWIRWNNLISTPYPIVRSADSRTYLGKVKEIILDNNTSVILANTESVANSGGVSYILWFWGKIGYVLSFNVFQVYLLMTFFTAFLTFLSLYYLISRVVERKLLSIVATLVIAFVVIQNNLDRPSLTQLSLWITFLYVGAIIDYFREKKSSKLLIIFSTFILTIFSNPFYSIFSCIFLFLMAVYNKGKLDLIFKLVSILIAFICLIYFIKIQASNPEILQMQLRNGVLFDRYPSAVNLILVCIFPIALLVLIHIVNLPKIRHSSFIIISMASLIISINSNLITGKVFEMESHYRLLAHILVGVSLTLILIENFGFMLLRFMILGILLLSGFNLLNNFTTDKDSDFIPWTKKEISLFDELKRPSYKDVVVLGSSNLKNPDLLSYIPLYTDSKVYWNELIFNEKITDTEILNRFACTIPKGYSFNKFQNEDYPRIFAHKFINAEYRYPKWNKVMKLLGKEVFSLDAIRFEKLKQFNQLIGIYESKCTTGKFLYKIDYILDQDLNLKKVSKW